MPDISKIDDDDFNEAVDKYLADNPPITNASLRSEIATLQAKLDRAVVGLERQARGWGNVLELDIISERHRTSVNVLADEAQSLIKELRP